MNSGFWVRPEEHDVINKWIAELDNINHAKLSILSTKQGWGKLNMSRSVINEPLCMGGEKYEWGLGTHADSEIVLHYSKPVKTFRAHVGVDYNKASINDTAKIMFSVWVNECCVSKSQYLDVNSQPELLVADIGNVNEFTLKVTAENSIHFAHADWGKAEIITSTDEVIQVGMSDMAYNVNTLPISFIYNGMSSEDWLFKYGIKHIQSTEKTFIKHHFICSDSETGLEFTLELQEYKDFPACLWNVKFKNTGKNPTPIIEQIKTINLTWPVQEHKKLYRAKGSFHYETEKNAGEAFRDNFKLITEDLSLVSKITMGGGGGRSSVDWMPYFNFEGANEGLMFGIGWTGQWLAQIKNLNDNNVCFCAGMENIRTTLLPGETISQPSILMIYWQGNDAIRGHNLLRHFIFEKLAPHDSRGKNIQAPASNLTWGGMVASSHLTRIQNLVKEKIPVDYYWIDAGWYGEAGPNTDEFSPQWGSQTGNWSINRDTYPDGFKAISAAVHAADKKFLLWLEPERAIYGTPITKEHPEYFLGEKKKDANLLLNLGNPDARRWCTELISGLIKTQGIDCYRQDFNISPFPFWQANDTPDRVGISEIRYIEGLYNFLGELRQRFPDLLIDNCASGGRRLDFEMMRYSIPLWASDMQCFPDYITERNQQQVNGLSYWLPQFSFGTQDHAGDSYHFRSTIAAGVVIHLATYERCPISADYPYQWLRDRLYEYHRAKVFFSGDFYPLMDQSGSFKDWSAYQFYRPDLNAGILLVFRKKDSLIEKVRFKLCGLSPDLSYTVENADSKTITSSTGQELLERGFSVEIENKRDSRLFFFRSVGSDK